MVTLEAYTVPRGIPYDESGEKWLDFEQIVGIEDGANTIWLPHNTDSYRNKSVHCRGYDLELVKETSLEVSDTQALALLGFFEGKLLGEGWADQDPDEPVYDCHWLAFWLSGLITDKTSLSKSTMLASGVVHTGTVTKAAIAPADIGVIGGSTSQIAKADHTFISLQNRRCLQALGVNGVIALCDQVPVIDLYTRYSEYRTYVEEKDYGVHELKPAESQPDR